MSDKPMITVESAQSIARTILAKALADAYVSGVEFAETLTMDQQVALLAASHMAYREMAEEAEDAIEIDSDFELLKNELKPKVQWATAEELNDLHNREWGGGE